MTEPLFDGYEPPESPVPDPELSAGRRLTQRQTLHIRAGQHPLTGGILHPQADRHATKDDARGLAFTCGTCVHREIHTHNNGRYPKCMQPQVGRDSRSATSDVRAWWPACGQYEEAT